MKLKVKRPERVTTGRTQSYRVHLTLEDGDPRVDTKLFVCTRDSSSGLHQLDRIAKGSELGITTDPSKDEYRTAVADIYVHSEGLADLLISSVIADLRARTDWSAGGIVEINGAMP